MKRKFRAPAALGSSVLPPGRFVNRQAAHADRHDVGQVRVNGRAAGRRGMNIRAASQITTRNTGRSAI